MKWLCVFPVFTLALLCSGCRKQEQAVVGVAQHAVSAGEKARQAAQVAADQKDQQRDQLERIPLPTKSLYIDIKEPNAWANPYLSVEADAIVVHTTDGNVEKTGPHADSTHRQQMRIARSALIASLIALPASAWRYGRVVAIAETPQAPKADRPAIRRNVEAAIQQLNDLGIVVQEWPTK